MTKKKTDLKNKITLLLLLAFFSFFFTVLIKTTTNNGVEFKGLKVVTTIYPISEFAKSVGGDKITILNLLPPGVEPHSFEPKPTDAVQINQSDIFIYTSKTMEVWANELLEGTTNKNLTIIEASKNLNLIKDTDPDENGFDPHIWLDFSNAKEMVKKITVSFIQKDPANKSLFELNEKNYLKKIDELDNKYKKTLSNCSSNEIYYAGHYAFGYMAKRYGLKYTAAQGISPDSEVTSKQLVEFVKDVKDKNIKYIFYEELSSPKIAETISKETGAQMLLLSAAHNITKEEVKNKTTFLTIMERNLLNLATGLGCKVS